MPHRLVFGRRRQSPPALGRAGYDPRPMFYVLLSVLPVLLVLSALASASETALFSLSATDRQEIGRCSPRIGRAVEKLLSQPRLLLIQVLVLNMTINVLYFVISSVMTIRAANPAAAGAISVGSVLAVILFGEVYAKVLAGAHARAAAERLALPLVGIRGAMLPILLGLDRFAVGPLARLLHPGPACTGVEREELTALLEQSSGVLSVSERQVLREVVELRHRRVRDVMAPRVDLRWVEGDWTPGRPLPGGQEFVPASGDGLHRHVAFSIDSKLALAGSDRRWRTEPVFVPEQARLDQLLSELARRDAEHAYCVDEFGEIRGLVRVEDVIDELVSGVSHARAESVAMVEPGVWRVPGRMPAHDFAEVFTVPEFEQSSTEEGVSTVAGLLAAKLGKVPDEGDRVRSGRLELIVTKMNNRAVEEVEVRTIEQETGA
ncbi:MAG: DUF21 domain-containing protein [Leptolyngbya sp. PLA3]|nr:MAG: DUF21 domain-containing protein [Cyanobacteria bacterium CYA]MCE7969296.1 DUF21 domain-containing protein [Leptolyngbya sp. PL-A3]